MSISKFIGSIRKSKSFFSHQLINFHFSFANLLLWPDGMAYSAWINLTKSLLWFIGSNYNLSYKARKRRKPSRRYRRFLQQKERLETEVTQQEISKIMGEFESVETANNEDVKIELITMLKKFWERKNISQHIEEIIPDSRNQDLITYSKQSIMMSALAIFLFRTGSGNKFDDKSHDEDEKYSQQSEGSDVTCSEGSDVTC